MKPPYKVRVLFDMNGSIREPGSYRRWMTVEDGFDTEKEARLFGRRFLNWVPTRKAEIVSDDAERTVITR